MGEAGRGLIWSHSGLYSLHSLLEDDQGELIMEFAEVRASQILLEEGDGTFGGIGVRG